MWTTLTSISRCLLALLGLLGLNALAAELDGIQLPGSLVVDGKTLYLNGFGLRTYTILAIHIYVAGLYLEHLSTDPEAVISSQETKLLTIRFERAVSADDARKAWRDGLARNCVSPCRLDPSDIDKFLAAIPAMHAGDNYSLLFTRQSTTVTVSGRPLGIVSQPLFAQALLATFLGPAPASPILKQELLRGHG